MQLNKLFYNQNLNVNLKIKQNSNKNKVNKLYYLNKFNLLLYQGLIYELNKVKFKFKQFKLKIIQR